jgi:hypothetical protein
MGYLILHPRWTLRWRSSTELVLRSSLLVELLSLFATSFAACVDVGRQRIEIVTRRWWRRTRRSIPLDSLGYIDRDAVQVHVSDEDSLRSQPRTRVTVFLRLMPSGEKLELASFLDEERSLLVTGPRAWEVLGEHLAKATAKPFGLHARIGAQLESSGYVCAGCGRPAPVQRPTCLHCGAAVVRRDSPSR